MLNPMRKSLLRWTVVLAIVFATMAAVPATADSPAAPVFESSACPDDTFPPDVAVDCGFVTVPENRSQPNGTTIKVAAALVHATDSNVKDDPIVFLDGGPSFGAISSFALGAYFSGASFIQDRDLILVDTRGTGLSQPRLGCPEFDRASVASTYSKPFVDSDYAKNYKVAIAACRDRLTGDGIDLSAYNSAESAADLDAIRQALGYDQWNLLAWSADGVLGLTYMRLFPDGIRSSIIDSGQSAQWLGGLDYARGNAQRVEKVFAGCAANAACNALYPNIRTLFFNQVHQLQAHPALIPIPAFEPRPVTIRFDGTWLYNEVSYGIFPGNKYEPEHIHDLLSDIWRMTHGELKRVMQEHFGTGPQESDNDSAFAEGKTMSYVCHDVVGFISQSDLNQAALDVPELAPLILDPNFDLPTGPAGCRIWGVGVAAPAQHQPVSSTIPTLVLAGEYDGGGGVPPLITRQIPPTLPNSFYYEFPAGAHGQLADFNNASPCARTIAAQFLDAPSVRPDSGCIASVAPIDYTPPPDPLASAAKGVAPSPFDVRHFGWAHR